VLLAALAAVAAAQNISVSGLSAGAFAAVQFQVAFSSTVHGVGIVAGGPYWCSMDLLEVALTSCLHEPELIVLELLYGSVTAFAAANTIDNPEYLADARVWMYSSPDDTVVLTGVVNKLEAFYQSYKATTQGIFNHSSEHGMPTLNYGVPCGQLESPFILSCGYDAAGALLQYIYSDTLQPANQSWSASQIRTLPQAKYLPSAYSAGGLSPLSMGPDAYVFVPSGCSWPPPTGCDFHVVLHGCEQSINSIGQDYVLHAGYNGWGESNNIVMLYPQIVASELEPVNPEACMDWWGYTGIGYATQDAPQLATFYNMAQALTGQSA